MAPSSLTRILLTNDDGFGAPGLKLLEEIAAGLAAECNGEVWVVAPEHDQSGTSHSISLHTPLRLTRHDERHWGVSGTPADCVVMALRHLMAEAPPTLVLSGINRGANLGVESVFSGTVGAAMMAMMLGVPSLALSQAWADPTHIRWDSARRHAPDVIRKLLATGWGDQTCLNVNFPNRAPDEVGPLTLSRQGPGVVETVDVETRTDPRNLEYHWLRFRRGPREQFSDSDVTVVRSGAIAVTPLRYDRTDEQAFADLATMLPVPA